MLNIVCENILKMIYSLLVEIIFSNWFNKQCKCVAYAVLEIGLLSIKLK